MNVLNMANVIALIDKDSAFDGITRHIANQVPRRANQFDALIGIEQAAIADAHILAIFRIDAGWIWNRRHIGLLPLGVGNNQTGYGGVIPDHFNERRAVRRTAAG